MEERALKHIKEMLVARGIKADDFVELGEVLDDTKMWTFEKVLVIFSLKTRVTDRELKNCIKYSEDNDYKYGTIIVSPSHASDNVLDSLRNYINNKENSLIQFFEIRHLQLNNSKHVKVPKHRIVDEKEIPEILIKTNVKDPYMFRKIDSQDPMARWVGARPGDVLEVTGMCEVSVENKRYLFCVANVVNG